MQDIAVVRTVLFPCISKSVKKKQKGSERHKKSDHRYSKNNFIQGVINQTRLCQLGKELIEEGRRQNTTENDAEKVNGND